MITNLKQAATILAPTRSKTEGAGTYNREPQRLADTGTTESGSEKLSHGKLYTLVVGAVAVRVAWTNTEPGGSDVETTDLRTHASYADEPSAASTET